MEEIGQVDIIIYNINGNNLNVKKYRLKNSPRETFITLSIYTLQKFIHFWRESKRIERFTGDRLLLSRIMKIREKYRHVFTRRI